MRLLDEGEGGEQDIFPSAMMAAIWTAAVGRFVQVQEVEG